MSALKLISKRSVFLVGLDIFSIYVSFQIAGVIRSWDMEFVWERSLGFYFSLMLYPLIFYIFDLYHPFKYFKSSTIIDVIVSVTIGSLILAAMAYADKSFTQPRLIFVYASLLLVVFVNLTRRFYDYLFKSKFLDRKALIIGTGQLAYEMADLIKRTPHTGIEVVGLISEEKKKLKNFVHKKGTASIVGHIGDLVSVIDWYSVDMVILALSRNEEISESRVMAELLEKRVIVTSSVYLFERLTGEVPYRFFGEHYLLGLMSHVRMRPYLKIKRILDVIFSVFLLVMFSPILLVCMGCLALDKPKEIFFMQKRIGKNSKPFLLYKLRSMKKIKNGKLVVTPFGAFIRKYRIDEIPQLLNVFFGDMSLVGPRPEIPYFVNRCRSKIPFYDAVFTIKPGLTGWAQVKFRYTTSIKDYDQKFRFNLYYLKNISLTLDLLIILKTIRVVVLGRGQ